MAHAAADPRATDRPSPTSPTSPPTSPNDRLFRYLEKLSNGGFFGKVVVSFQNGKVSDVKIEQTKKLEDL